MEQELDTKQELDYLKLYLDAAIDSSSRHRKIVVIMVTASILILGTLWNSVFFGWLNSRVKIHESASTVLNSILKKKSIEKLKLLEENTTPLSESLQGELFKAQIRHLTEKTGTFDNYDNKVNELNSLVTLEISHCKDYLDFKALEVFNARNFDEISNDSEKVAALLSRIEPQKQELQKVKGQNFFLIRIPFFGIAFEINDLGFLGGTTFVVLLLWFRLSLWNEVNNLQFIALTTSSANIRFSYHYLAMQQVLTIPPEFWKKKDVSKSEQVVRVLQHKPWARIPKLLYYLPVFIQLMVLIYDLISLKYGLVINPTLTWIGLFLTFSLFVLAAYLTYICRQLITALDDVWQKFADKAGESSSVEFQRKLEYKFPKIDNS